MNEDAIILVVEDDHDDALLLQQAFRRAGILNPVKILVNAEQAFRYLSGEGPFADRESFPVPSIIFFDLHLPNPGGLEFMHWLKSRPDFSEIRIVAMTGLGAIEERQQAYDSGANLVFSKPISFEALVEEVRFACEEFLVR